MKTTFFIILIAIIVLLPVGSSAQVQGPSSTVNIGGLDMYCNTPQGYASIYLDPLYNNVIGRASNNGYPVIQLGPAFFNSVPSFVGQFWFLHECAHHIVGGNEAGADCFAIRNLRNLGLVNHPNQIGFLLNQVSQMPGSFAHLPGPARAQNIYACFSS